MKDNFRKNYSLIRRLVNGKISRALFILEWAELLKGSEPKTETPFVYPAQEDNSYMVIE